MYVGLLNLGYFTTSYVIDRVLLKKPRRISSSRFVFALTADATLVAYVLLTRNLE